MRYAVRSANFDAKYIYLLLLTAKSHKADLVHGLNAAPTTILSNLSIRWN